jgi:hypothetical protein
MRNEEVRSFADVRSTLDVQMLATALRSASRPYPEFVTKYLDALHLLARN